MLTEEVCSLEKFGVISRNMKSLYLQVAVVSAFAQTLRRYTSLNHLAQAARAVLQNTSQINQMLSDLNRVDFANVQVLLSEIKHDVCKCQMLMSGGDC